MKLARRMDVILVITLGKDIYILYLRTACTGILHIMLVLVFYKGLEKKGGC